MSQTQNKESITKVKYSIYRPAGNDTAFVYGLEYTQDQRKKINDLIMKKHPNVEQVGFIESNHKPELQMAGGEFCGNATRSAAYNYLNGKAGNLQMLVNSKDLINAGVDEEGNAWCEIPLYHGDDVITKKEPGIFIVKMNGMITIVIQEEQARKYLSDKERLKELGMEFIHKYHLEYSEAVGVMFCEKNESVIKINPVVWVKDINTLFYETACGSGTTATSMVEAYLQKKSIRLSILQPSELIITANIVYEEETFKKAIISGNVETDGKIHLLELEGENDMLTRKIKAITPDAIEDFIEAYKVFCNPPYSEAWTESMIKDEYYSLTKYGHVYGYYIGEKCVGTVTFRKMLLKDEHPVYYEHPEKVAYLSDLTVLEEYRRKGIGTELMKYALKVMKDEKFERVYMKTLEIGKSMSYSIAIKQGFKLLEGVNSIDKMSRLCKERKEEDLKIYLDREL